MSSKKFKSQIPKMLYMFGIISSFSPKLRLANGSDHILKALDDAMATFMSTSSMFRELPWDQTLALRQSFVPRACQLHYAKSPLKIVRAKQQYMYDDLGQQFLDCISVVAHVGHCHPAVVNAGESQMNQVICCEGFIPESYREYSNQLLRTLPDNFNACIILNSSSEANDLALQLARAYTKREDVVVVDHSFHGGLGNIAEISPKQFRNCSLPKKEYVHVIPLPDVYHGVYKADDPDAGDKYVQDSKRIINQAISNGRKIACFMSEPIFTCSGMVFPPQNYLKAIYEFIHSVGAICIADEAQTSLGRIGRQFWGFQMQDAIPDIITVGKTLGNGYPVAALITRSEIAAMIPNITNVPLPEPVSCAMGLSVLITTEQEKLAENAVLVGDVLKNGLIEIMDRHEYVGDVTGSGLLIGIAIVQDKSSRKPAEEIAERIVYMLKDEFILTANDGPYRNVICLSPPLCFTCDNALTFLEIFDKVLTTLASSSIERFNQQGTSRMFSGLPRLSSNVPLDVIFSTDNNIADSDSEDEPLRKRPNNFADID